MAAAAATPAAGGSKEGASGAGGGVTDGGDESKWCLPASSDELQQYDADAGSVRLMGDPMLRQRSAEVDPKDAAVAAARHTLQASLRGFRKKFGFGRGISAVQVRRRWHEHTHTCGRCAFQGRAGLVMRVC